MQHFNYVSQFSDFKLRENLMKTFIKEILIRKWSLEVTHIYC